MGPTTYQKLYEFLRNRLGSTGDTARAMEMVDTIIRENSGPLERKRVFEAALAGLSTRMTTDEKELTPKEVVQFANEVADAAEGEG